ncbi:NADH-dependent phenylglyoxylate dehydrogenase subunit alpha [Anaerohalosphaera lusitana]|uniref:NADH-dependent phenylglyoxylate dehydrogenase subunit alpha n=2 Tax=Anaerohalosphaera lusitana TaxID=1936003 RepID=A0A1U9NKU8_9BACT|nr:NADH-dependent phenylglyoxylate dehydrogenase subunit alpha [Anaerohalosphaera lusitana]
MAEKILLKGNEAMVEAAIEAKCRFFAGYPITPQNEVPETMARRMPQVGGTFIQAESELAAINMIFGASAAGARCMTSSSSPGISLKLEGISYIAAAELPCVIANVQRGGPGLGNIRAAQGDYFQAVKGGGHGDYRLIVLAPAGVQELYDLTMKAFDWADLYRNPVLMLGDGLLGQTAEPVVKKKYRPACKLPKKDWALTGCTNRKSNVVKTLMLGSVEALADHNRHLVQKYKKIESELSLVEEYMTDDAELIVSGYGMTARIAKGAVKNARAKGLKVGLIRPISVWPFPTDTFKRAAEKADKFLVVEMSNGQFVEDVKLAIECKKPVEFMGVGGGWYPTPENVLEKIETVLGG